MPSDSTQSRSAPDSVGVSVSAKLPCLPRTGFRIRIHSFCEVPEGGMVALRRSRDLPMDRFLLVLPPVGILNKFLFNLQYLLVYFSDHN